MPPRLPLLQIIITSTCLNNQNSIMRIIFIFFIERECIEFIYCQYTPAVWREISNTLPLWKKEWQYTASSRDELENMPLLSAVYYYIIIILYYQNHFNSNYHITVDLTSWTEWSHLESSRCHCLKTRFWKMLKQSKQQPLKFKDMIWRLKINWFLSLVAWSPGKVVAVPFLFCLFCLFHICVFSKIQE